MNLHGGCQSGVTPKPYVADGKVFVDLGLSYLVASPEEARKFAADLVAAAETAAPLVPVAGLQVANDEASGDGAAA